jgi:hypothetical protein
MFLRATVRKKDGKEHTYYSVVENKRVAEGRVVQRHVLYLGEINSSQELAWRKSMEVLDETQQRPRTISLFPEDRFEAVVDAAVVRLKLSQMRLRRPRQWGGCWLALQVWRELELDEFWAERLLPSRKGTRWIVGDDEFLVDTNDPAAVAASLERARRSDHDAESKRFERARDCSWGMIAERYRQFFTDVLSRHTGL